MDHAKPELYMAPNEISPEFISSWDINGLMVPLVAKMTPVWLHILEAETERKQAKMGTKSPKS